MRIILFFDLPTITSDDRRQYRKFRKFLITDGFIMLQESVYSKLLCNYVSCNLEMSKLEKIKPKNGIVQCMTITEKQYASMIFLKGEKNNGVVDSTNRLVIL